MSAISGAGSSASLLYLVIQSSGQSSGSSSCDDPNMDPSGDPTAAGSAGQQSPLGDLRSQIETAVTDSVSQLPADSSPEDIFKAVRSAVQDTLKANGLDPSQIGGPRGGGHHHHHHAGGAGGASGDPSGAASTSGADGDGDDGRTASDPLLAALDSTAGTSNATPSTTGSTSSLLAVFASGPNAADALSTLVQQLSGGNSSENGQSGGQSQTTASPLLAALQNHSSGNLNLTDIFQQLFQNFPNGTGLDVKV